MPPQRRKTDGGMRGTRRGRSQAARGAARRVRQAAQRTQAASLESEQNKALQSYMEDIKRQLATFTATVQAFKQKGAEMQSLFPASRQMVTHLNTAEPSRAIRDLSPVSDSGNELNHFDEHGDDLYGPAYPKKQLTSVGKILESLPPFIRNKLSAVSESSLYKLLNEKQFVNPNEHLPKNRTLGPPTCNKTLCVNAEGGTAIKNAPKHDGIDGFPI